MKKKKLNILIYLIVRGKINYNIIVVDKHRVKKLVLLDVRIFLLGFLLYFQADKRIIRRRFFEEYRPVLPRMSAKFVPPLL